VEKKEHSYTVGISSTTRKTVWRCLKKLKIELSYYLANPLLEIYRKECKSGYNKGTCTPMFILHYLQKLSYGNNLRCPTTDERMKKM
jgi:hypothetical protein